MDTFLCFSWVLEEVGEVLFSLCGVYHWKPNPAVPEGILSPPALSSKIWSFLNSAVLPLHSHQTARDKTCEQIEQILTPFPSTAPNSMKLRGLTSLIPFAFPGRHREFCNPAPRTFLHITHGLLTSEKNNCVLEPRPYALRKQAISAWHARVVVLKHSLRGNWPRDQYQIGF